MMLDDILASVRARLPDIRGRADDIRARAEAMPAPPSFRKALTVEGMSVVAEVKRRSPSRGELAADLDPGALAAAYARGGAAAISVLTEPDHFSGSPADLRTVADQAGVPVLRKDFVLDAVQVWEAAAWGASAVLLIVAALDDPMLAHLLSEAETARIDALVEVHTEQEARRAMAAGASVVGVNNRDLSDFTVDVGTSERLAPLLADADVTVAESGVFTRADAMRMADAGYDAVLVGEALIRAADPAALVAELRVRR